MAARSLISSSGGGTVVWGGEVVPGVSEDGLEDAGREFSREDGHDLDGSGTLRLAMPASRSSRTEV